jgi:uncharacterized protein with von Willebrand factor type A (vWA) domain
MSSLRLALEAQRRLGECLIRAIREQTVGSVVGAADLRTMAHDPEIKRAIQIVNPAFAGTEQDGLEIRDELEAM